MVTKLEFFEAAQYAYQVETRYKRYVELEFNRNRKLLSRKRRKEYLAAAFERELRIYNQPLWEYIMSRGIDCFDRPDLMDEFLDACIDKQWVEEIRTKLNNLYLHE